jgi:hypothetical protein
MIILKDPHPAGFLPNIHIRRIFEYPIEVITRLIFPAIFTCLRRKKSADVIWRIFRVEEFLSELLLLEQSNASTHVV